jgi:hypothetical protein
MELILSQEGGADIETNPLLTPKTKIKTSILNGDDVI